MTERGVFAVSRSIWDDPDFAPEEFTEREAMIWLVGAAAWTDRSVRGACGPISLARGEFCFSVRFLAEKWRWSKSRVARFLNRLKNRDTLRDTSRDGAQVYSIRNYNKFQIVGLPKRDSNQDDLWDASGTAAGQQRDKEEELKHLRKEKTFPNGKGGDPPPDGAALVRKQVWNEGKALLKEARGIADSTAGQLVTKLVQASGNNLTLCLAKVRECRQTSPPPVDPFTWIMGRVSSRKAESEQALTREAEENNLRKVREIENGGQNRDVH